MERTPAIEQLIALARRIAEAVGLRPRADVTLEEIEPLIQLMSMFTPELLGLVPQAAHAYIVPVTMRPLDIRYLHIAQEEGFSIGVFVLPPGACIPLHNHPNMCVISRVLYGSVKITSYDHHQGEPGNSSRVRGSQPSQPQGRGGAAAGTAGAGRGEGGGGGGGHPHLLATLRASSWHGAPHTSALSPSVANFHEIEAGEDGTAILDVLLPPYDEDSDRDCTYYRAEQTSGPWVRLEPCYPGDHFRVVRGNYVSPYSI